VSSAALRRARRRRRRQEAGYAAVVTALLASIVFLGMAAIGVDTARWYMELERVQKAADAAALAGVTYMPNDFPDAQATALASALSNGFDDASASVVVTVAVGTKPSELKVTISSRVDNTFGGMIGIARSWMTRSAVADYTAPAPMGSPCNTFGNEPPSQPVPAAQPAGSALPSSPFPNCSSTPQFWAAIEGPSTDKVQGDRFMDNYCSGTSNAGTTTGCSGGKNTEYRPEGYFWAVHVEPQAVGTAITVQIYDPAYMNTGIDCSSLYSSGTLSAYMNDYASTDGNARYTKDSAGKAYCSGDYIPGSSTVDPPVMSFALRHANDTFNPKVATPINPSQCTKQFVGQSGPPSVTELTQWTNVAHTTKNASYNLQKAQLFHQWVPLCTFTPDTPGDYYLQVRTNVTVAGGTAVANTNPNGNTMTSLIYTGNPAVTAADGNTLAGVGLNSFAMRAVPSDDTKKKYIAVAGNESMPILQNSTGSTAKFNLIRALPGTRGQYIAFDFYDPADGAGTDGATVQIFPPADATGSVKTGTGGTPPNCKHAKNAAAFTTATDCQVTVKNTTHDGQVEHIVIPIPNDYNCDPSTLGGCWFSVQIHFPSTVTDFTTWTANIGGDPVRLIE
jgi:Flp pilus assembly protein TadG